MGVLQFATMTDTTPSSRSSRATGWDPQVGHPQRRQVLAISCLSLVIVVIAVSSLNVAIPTILRDLKPSSTQLLWIIDAYALVFAGFLLLAGAIGDRFGRKGALLCGLAVFGTGALAASQATDPNVLIATRTIMGIGAAFVMPATLSIVTSVFPPAERPTAIATWAAFAGAGGALGPLLGGLMVAIGLMVVAAGMGLAMAPASTAIVSSLPMSKAGVASAVNDVTREVGGALGIAVLGTILTSRFTTLMDERVPAPRPLFWRGKPT